MNLNNLKPAWQQFRLLNSLESIDKEEILCLIELAEDMTVNKTHRFLMTSAMFIFLTFCCYGG